MDLESQPSCVNSETISTPQTPDRWGLQLQFRTLYLKRDQNEQIEESRMIKRKNIFKIKEQQRKKKNIHMKKQFLENMSRENDSIITNPNTHLNEQDSTTFSQFESRNSLDFLSSTNNSDNETV
ncbi:hypothetical protein ABPG74_018466 [Tetrahymena malaccensis]